MNSIRIEGDIQPLLNRFKSLSEIDKKGINHSIAESIKSSTKERFRTEKAPDGKKWEKSKRVSDQGGITLVDTAGLKNSIKYSADKSGFAVGTNKIYAATHQLGAKNRRITIRAHTPKGLIFQINGQWIRKKEVKISVNIPKRPFLGLSDEDMDEIKGVINDYFAEE